MKRAHRSTAWILSTSVTLAAATALGADWSQWRGRARRREAPDFVAPQSWPKQLTPKWKVTVGDGRRHAGPRRRSPLRLLPRKQPGSHALPRRRDG